jgi:hypothetical protein
MIMLTFVTAPRIVSNACAHANHGTSEPEKVSEQKAIESATNTFGFLLKKGILDKTWAKVKAASAGQKQVDGHTEWVVLFTNPAVTDKSKETLFIFLRADGSYLAANFTGK